MYNMGQALVKAMGYQNTDDFLTPPPPAQQGPSMRDQMAQAEMQMKQKELEIKQGELQVKFMRVQKDAEEAAVDAQLKAAELNLEAEQNRPVAIG